MAAADGGWHGGAGSDVAAVLIRNLSASNQTRANALAAVFYGRIGATDIESFQGQVASSTKGNNNLPAPPSNPGLFAPGGGGSTGNPPSVLDPNPPSSPIDFPTSSPGDGVLG